MPNATGPAGRPAPVVVAAAVLSLMAAVGLAHAIAGLASLNGIVDRFRATTVASQSDVGTTVALLRGAVVIATVVAVVMAVLLVVLALGILQGSSGARIATWVVCVLGLLCGCGGLTALVVQRAVPWTFSADNQVAADLVGALTSAYPPWWIGVGAGLSVAQALGYLVVAVLLALPAATAFFGRRPPAYGQRPTPSTPPSPLM
jgi:hypothetical protein